MNAEAEPAELQSSSSTHKIAPASAPMQTTPTSKVESDALVSRASYRAASETAPPGTDPLAPRPTDIGARAAEGPLWGPSNVLL
jgi:hypothetical protein